MKVLIQRVSRAQVSIQGSVHGNISRGLVVFLGVRQADTDADAETLARKTAQLRVFPDEQDRMHLSLRDIGGQALVISQFTLYADTRKGARPSFTAAAAPAPAEARYHHFVQALADIIGNTNVQTGRFRHNMQVELVNDGPVTIEINTDAARP